MFEYRVTLPSLLYQRYRLQMLFARQCLDQSYLWLCIDSKPPRINLIMRMCQLLHYLASRLTFIRSCDVWKEVSRLVEQVSV
jgi:hypothetical protein